MTSAKLRPLASLRSVGAEGGTCAAPALLTSGPDEQDGSDGGMAKKKLHALSCDVGAPELLQSVAETSPACMH